MTRTAEIILEHIGPYAEEGAQRSKGQTDGIEAMELLGQDLYLNERFQNWCLSGFEAAASHGSPMAFVAVASNFIRLGYKVAMQELSEGREA